MNLNVGKREVQPIGSPRAARKNGNANKLDIQDRAFHDWYRFVLSYPPHLVRDYIDKFGLSDKSIVLDPFCGTGTTLVEAKLRRMGTIGIEAHPFSQFAASVKLDWNINPDQFLPEAREIAYTALNLLSLQGIEDSQVLDIVPKNLIFKTISSEAQNLILANSISPLPLHKTLVLLDCLKSHEKEAYYRHALLALANALVFKISNLHFGPEVGVRNPKIDVPVISNWLVEVEKMVDDLYLVQGKKYPGAKVYLADARQIGNLIAPKTVHAVITSPPYPNEKDYTRTTRLESVLLGFIQTKAELRALKKTMIRSNTRGVYKEDDDDKWVAEHEEIQRIANAIEKRRIELEKDSGFERLYSRVTKLYFGGMARHLADLRNILCSGAQLAYVVGDQASYLRIKIQTGQILADIAMALGYEVVRIDLFRTRLATATKEQLREEVVILQWPGKKG
jgi:DNA methylase